MSSSVQAGQKSLAAALKLWPRSLWLNNAFRMQLIEEIIKHFMFLYKTRDLLREQDIIDD